MLKPLKYISTFWFIVLPITITLIVSFSILRQFMEDNVTRIAQSEINRSLIQASRKVENTVRTLMINDPGKMTGFHLLLDSFRGDRKAVDTLNRNRQIQIDQLDSALHLISKDTQPIAEESTIKRLWRKYGQQMRSITLLPTQPDIRVTIIPAPVVREEMLEKVAVIHPKRYPRPDEIETLVIATGKEFNGHVTLNRQSYLQVTSPILAGTRCMKCHLSAIEGQPMAAITVRANLEKSSAAIALLTKRVVIFGALILLFILLVVLLVSRYIVISLDRINSQVMRFARGDYETVIKARGVRETISLAQSFESARIRIHDFNHTILKNSSSLIFIIDEAGKVTSDYSQSVQDLFGIIENKSVNETIFQPLGEDIAPLLEVVFTRNGSISFEEMTALAPGELEVNRRNYQLNYIPVYEGDPQKLTKILVFGENITALKRMAKARVAERQQNSMIIEIVKNPVGFLEFYQESKRLLESGQTIMKRDDGLLTEVELIEIRRILRTIKKTAHAFKIQNLVPSANDNPALETINSAQLIGRKTVNPILSDTFNELERIYGIFQKYVGELDQKDLITITKNEARQLSDKHPDLQTETDSWQQALQLDFIRRKATSVVQTTASQLGKEVTLEVDGEEGRISERTVKTISLALTQLLRNAVWHGIEDPTIREAVGKWPQGKISIQVQNKGNNIQIRVQDDGKGIHPEDLIDIAIEMGLMMPGTKLDPQKALNLIFKPGFSTARKISRTSKRDVGLDTVKSVLNKNKGIITVRSEAGVGTEFILIIHRNPSATAGVKKAT